MTGPTRIQLKRTRGWRMPPNTVKVDRTTRWGNPFVVRGSITQAEAVRRYRLVCEVPGAYFDGPDDPSTTDQVLAMARAKQAYQLRGMNLACWCRLGDPCHADVLLELANPK